VIELVAGQSNLVGYFDACLELWFRKGVQGVAALQALRKVLTLCGGFERLRAIPDQLNCFSPSRSKPILRQLTHALAFERKQTCEQENS